VLNLLAPVRLEGMDIFRDDSDPATFYLLPDTPGIPLDSNGSPDFLFLLYLRDAAELGANDEAGAGYIQFRTTLMVSADRRAAILAGLRALLGPGQEPRLVDPLWTAGTVELATFQAGADGLVRAATTSTPVALTGDLGASFRMDLTPAGADVFRGAFNAYADGAHQLPILINYHLSYAARVAATLTIHAAHSVVHERVWRYAQPYVFEPGIVGYRPLALDHPFQAAELPGLRQRFPTVRPMIDIVHFGQAVQECMVEDTITVTIEGGAAGDTATHDALQKIASDLITQNLVPALTTGGALPGSSTTSDGGQTTTTIFTLTEDAPAGTASFDLHVTDAQTVTRSADPSAPLHVLVADPQTLRSCFKELRLSDGFFAEMKVAVSTSGVDFAKDGIAKVHVFYRYQQVDAADPARPTIERHDDGVLNAATDTLLFRFDTARSVDGHHLEQYEYRVEVHWSQGGAPVIVDWTPSTSRALIITPPLLGAVRVEAVLTAPKSFVDSVRVELSYKTFTGALELTDAQPRAVWFQPTGEVTPMGQTAQPPAYRHRILYRVAGQEVATPWRDGTDESVEAPNPFVRILTFAVTPAALPDSGSVIAGNLTYADPAHDYRIVQPVRLSSGQTAQMTVPIFADGVETVTCTGVVSHADGSQTPLADATLAAGNNFVGPARLLRVSIRADLVDFSADRLVQVTMTLTHADGRTTSQDFLFDPVKHDTAVWTVELADGDPATYDATVHFFGVDRATDKVLKMTGHHEDVLLLDRAMEV
jgi:hypothetical protein